jgi:hypothetical protein
MTIRAENIDAIDFSDVANLRKERASPVHPGEILLEEG